MGHQSSNWPSEEDRIYHGVQSDEVVNKDEDARVFVESAAFDWTRRDHATVLRELQPADPIVRFKWGYLGSGTNSVSHAILHDALGFEPTLRMRQAFVEDVLSQCPDEFRLRRGAVLRWARGLVAQHGITDDKLPSVLKSLPPVDRMDYERRPVSQPER